MARGVLRTANLPQLQNLIKRDPSAYKEEFLQQWNHYNSMRQIFQISPSEHANDFRELISFIAQVSLCLYFVYLCNTSPTQGCAMLPQRNLRVPFTFVFSALGTFWDIITGSQACIRAEPGHAQEQGRHWIC